jgi:hypothetical protein
MICRILCLLLLLLLELHVVCKGGVFVFVVLDSLWDVAVAVAVVAVCLVVHTGVGTQGSHVRSGPAQHGTAQHSTEQDMHKWKTQVEY